MDIKTFIIPHQYRLKTTADHLTVAVIIPSYKPNKLTLQLINDIVNWHPEFKIYLVDDCTPKDDSLSAKIFQQAACHKNLNLLRTPSNKLKAGAINFALNAIQAKQSLPDVIFTCDDDIAISKETLPAMVRALAMVETFGAVCSQSRVSNKNKNLLTRLQGLEYLGFNTARLSDEGFFQGPLVMHGMLTAFRAKMLLDLQGFDENCLIEDYEITVRLKKQGWHVAMIADAPAWTSVPDNFWSLWKQRVRWVYGGLTVLSKAKSVSPVIQDAIGHGIFLATLALILASFLLAPSGIGSGSSNFTLYLSRIIITLSVIQLLIWYSFQLWTMKLYAEKDRKDWIIRIAMIPEFVYTNIMSIVLLGAYLFFLFNASTKSVPVTAKFTNRITGIIRQGFQKLGFTQTWGTRTASTN